MAATRISASRCIIEVPLGTIRTLDRIGALPRLPQEITNAQVSPHRREPTPDDMICLRWLLVIEGKDTGWESAFQIPRVVGVGAFWNRYDFHSGTDASEIIHLAGSRRAIRELVVRICEIAKADGRHVFGSIGGANIELRRMLRKLGHCATRVTFEAI